MVFHMAELDGYAPLEQREALIAAFDGNPNATFYIYQGQDHAFAREEGEHYDKPSALMAYGANDGALPPHHRPGLRPVEAVGGPHRTSSSARATCPTRWARWSPSRT